MDLLKFVFTDFWHWLGAFILLGIVVEGLVAVVAIVCSPRKRSPPRA